MRVGGAGPNIAQFLVWLQPRENFVSDLGATCSPTFYLFSREMITGSNGQCLAKTFTVLIKS